MASGGRAFAAKLNPLGSLVYATYLDLFAANIAVDSKGRVWLAGTTCPASAGPVGSNCDTSVYGTAAAIRELDASGSHLLVSRSFGGGSGAKFTGAKLDAAAGVAVDAGDAVWVVGSVQTNSVPTTTDSLEPRPADSLFAIQGVRLAYILRFSPSGDITYGTYVGQDRGTYARTIDSVTIDAQGKPYFVLNVDFSGSDVNPSSAVMVLSADGENVVASTNFGSFVQNVTLDGSGGLYVAGNTSRLAFLTTPGAYQPLYPGGFSSGSVAKFDLAATATQAQFSTIVNAASFVPGYSAEFPEGAVAAGEIVTLFGENLPANPKVTFDGHSAPILYADTKQINTVVPFEVISPTTTVLLAGVRGYVLPVWPAVPALFTVTGSGYGQLAALNEDGTVNSNSNPAKHNSVVTVYMTGVGAMSPTVADGQLGPLQPPYPAPVLGVSALMNNAPALDDGIPAPVMFAGQAPGLIAGAVQVNVEIPAGVPSGNVPLTIYVGNYRTQIASTTVAVF